MHRPSPTEDPPGPGARRRAALVSLACLLGPAAIAMVVVGTTLQGGAAEGARPLDRLYFGRSMSCGGTVSKAQWNAFVTRVIAPRLWVRDRVDVL